MTSLTPSSGGGGAGAGGGARKPRRRRGAVQPPERSGDPVRPPVDPAVAPAADPAESLRRFDPLVRDWFTDAFAAPTAAQAGAWDALGRGEHTLVVAPTGSGKTLAAFLSAIDDLVSRGSADRLPDGATADPTPARTPAA